MERSWTAFGQWLREERLRSGFSVAEAAHRSGFSRQQWDKLEKGDTGTKREKIPMIALALGLPESEVYLRAGFSAHTIPSADEEIVMLLARMNEEEKRRSIKVLRALVTA